VGEQVIRVAFDPSSTRGAKTGIGVYTESLIGALRQFAPQVEIALLEDNATVNQRTDQRMRREQFALPGLAERCKADLIHLTGFASPMRSKVPVVLTVMDLIGALFPQSFPPASRFYWSRYLPFTLLGARHIITLSDHSKQDIIRLTRVAPQKVTVIPAAIDSRFQLIENTKILDAARFRLRLPESYFLFVSTIEPRKGIDTLLRAYERVAPHVREHLVIVGKRGWYYNTLYTQARGIGLDRIHFVDYVSDQELPFVYNLATAFVFPSRYEGFGFTPLEAMACGVPVIASNSSSIPEVVADAGLLIPPNDVMGFAHAMISFASNPQQRELFREFGLQRAEAFSWQRAATATAATYARLVPTPQPKV
jgi:glycosyltransferase involved in cell wall biosynthesis